MISGVYHFLAFYIYFCMIYLNLIESLTKAMTSSKSTAATNDSNLGGQKGSGSQLYRLSITTYLTKISIKFNSPNMLK